MGALGTAVDRSADDAAIDEPPRGLAPERPSVQVWVALVVVGLGLVWVVLRPEAPQGAAAVVDLLVLPAALFGGARLLAGPTTISLPGFLVLFGLGAVVAPVVSLLVEGVAARVLDPGAAGAFGSLVEVAAPALPVVAVTSALLHSGRRPTVADLALAGMASGLGFLVIQTSLVTAASHEAPRWVTPLVAGWQRVQAPQGVPAVSFVGPGVATALIGLGVGATIRWRRRPWRLAPTLVAVCLLVVNRAVFDRQLRFARADEIPPPSALVDRVQQVTLGGALAIVLLVVGLVLSRPEARRLWSRVTAGSRRAPVADAGEVGDVPQTEVEPDGVVPAATAPEEPASNTAEAVDGTGTLVVALIAAVAAGTLFVALARSGHLGFLRDRPVALAVALVGFGYSLLRLANLRLLAAPALGGAGEPADDAAGELLTGHTGTVAGELLTGHPGTVAGELLTGHPGTVAGEVLTGRPDALADDHGGERPGGEGRELLCLAALGVSALGIVCSLLPAPAGQRPVHGALVLEAVRGWTAHVGQLGLLLGLAGLAAPPGPVAPQSSGGWADVLPWRARSSGWWRALLGPRPGRLGWRAFWRLALQGAGGGYGRGRERGRLPWLSRWRPPPVVEPDEEESSRPLTTTITIQPIDESAQSRAEFEGATVQEAMQAALAHLDAGLSSASLQLIDEGRPPKPGKPWTGRPARVRIVRSREDADPLLPPGRDSMCRSTCLSVVVEVVDHERAAPALTGGLEVVTSAEAGPPPTIEVTLSNPSRPGEPPVTLTCSREQLSPGRARYRSNPYSVDEGEDPAWVAAPATPARGVRVDDGEQLRVEYDEWEALVTVYDSWERQVIGVNQHLFDLTAAHHVTALARWEQERPGDRAVQRLRQCLAAVEAGRRLLASQAPDDEKAFLTTALLHQAMSLGAPSGADRVTERAAAAVDEHRRALTGDGREGCNDTFRSFLQTTIVGALWTKDAATDEEVAELAGWTNVSTKAEGW